MPFPNLPVSDFFRSLRRGKPRLYTSFSWFVKACPPQKAGIPKPFRGVQNGAEPRHHTSSFSADCKAAIDFAAYGTAEAVPFQSKSKLDQLGLQQFEVRTPQIS